MPRPSTVAVLAARSRCGRGHVVAALMAMGGTVVTAGVLLTVDVLTAGCGRSGGATTAQAPDERTYLCPMRCVKPGETRFYTQRGPGECPVCGMALEVATPAELQELAGIRTPVPAGEPLGAPSGAPIPGPHAGPRADPRAVPHGGHGQAIARPSSSSPADPAPSAPPAAAEPYEGQAR